MSDGISSRIRILIVDDHPMVRQGLSLLIQGQADLVLAGEAGTAREGVAFLQQHEVDLVVLDIRLPDEDGLVVLRAVASLRPRPSVLVLSSHEGEAVVGRAFEGGARGYVSKLAPAVELLAAIRTVAGGKSFVSADLSSKLAEHQTRAALKPREVAILELVASGLGNHAIGRQLGVSEKTVKNQLTVIFDKLEASDRTHAVILALDRGLIELSKGT